MTKIVAITGGIGSGKTTISKYLKKNNFAVHESDSAVSQIYTKPNKLFLGFLKKPHLRYLLFINFTLTLGYLPVYGSYLYRLQ